MQKNLSKTGIKDKIFNYGCPAVEYISNLDVGEYFNENMIDKRLKGNSLFKKMTKIFISNDPPRYNK